MIVSVTVSKIDVIPIVTIMILIMVLVVTIVITDFR